ncbi:MAG: hypothetical protein LIO62_04240 [Clostridiales bacterium]|nr:hypothetical protein [Clostridiales bacterium]
MAYFSDADINEAKRRVREMQSKASKFMGDEEQSENVINSINFHNIESEQPRSRSDDSSNSEESEKEDKSDLVILVLILLLSREGADNMLILALLYLLL